MPEQPSYKTSTLSRLTAICVVVFLGAATLSAIGVIGFKLPIEQAKQILEPFSWLTGLFVTAYLTARKTTGNGETRVQAPAP